MEESFYYIKHPDHIGRFFHWFTTIPSIHNYHREIRFSPSEDFISKSISLAFIGFIIMLLSRFKTETVLFCLTPIYILILAFLRQFIIGLYNTLQHKSQYKSKLKELPLKRDKWIKELPENYTKYSRYIVQKVEYKFNPETKIGNTACLLSESLKKKNLDVMQEADLLWNGVNLVPRKPRMRREKKDYWFKQFAYTADFIYLDIQNGIMLDIEIDEKHHFEDPRQEMKDERRNNIFLCSGWSIIRFKDSQVKLNPDQCADDIIKTISQIKLIHTIISKQLSTIPFSDMDLDEYKSEDLANYIIGKCLKQNKELFNNVDYEYYKKIDYSLYQLDNYLSDYYASKLKSA